ncbi:MAG: hypothetical protein LC667_09260, partial [Thioalkalivibrio sp.]|nr:hypothetical protein [Thioalkalivibrio sp.]
SATRKEELLLDDDALRISHAMRRQLAGVPELNQSDGIHPTVEGHERMAENLMPVLMRAVEASRASMAGTSR